MAATDPGPFLLRRDTRELARGVEALAGELPARDLPDVLAKANRTAVRKGSTTAFAGMSPRPVDWYRLQAGDDDTTDWYPQGIASSSEAGRADVQALAFTWYWKPSAGERGIRITFLGTGTAKYRHVLLVEPKGASYAAINVHAGGLAWHGDLLYVPDTSRGLRVFDLRHIYEVDGDEDRIGVRAGKHHAFGYRYVMPQVDAWRGTGQARFSFAGVDRSTTPHTLVCGEFADPAQQPGAIGRIARWAFAADGTLAAGADGLAPAADAFTLPAPRIQGGLSHRNRWYLSLGAGSTRNGSLLVTDGQAPVKVRKYPVGPEDLSCWQERGQLWSLTEFKGRRAVFAVPL
ncbi:hypothetical protein [Sphaerisporangium sp. TRM90804]|uniref:hypothetical protein n=1 Tax=Sphaerisporangium sp. TRM90804 TaxID=3031113 RepID=UPI002449F977|nr:hypothetical protein [Sphaerisporangium sp. TRM90804]MDH2427260.1 hypothetical protein [Sphaerisporangium sp. TRM90804]